MTSSFPAVLIRIFSYQLELMAKYKEIEQLPDAPVSLHAANGQRIIKDFAWRTTEELVEAYDEYAGGTEGAGNVDRCGEELADALHFFVELLIFAGITPQQCLAYNDQFPDALTASTPGELSWAFTHQLGLATNQLRNRPWKKTPVPTNEGRFRLQLLVCYRSMMQLWSSLGFTYLDMLAYYERKRSINVQRQQDGY